jgi:hypothetical protein
MNKEEEADKAIDITNDIITTLNEAGIDGNGVGIVLTMLMCVIGEAPVLSPEERTRMITTPTWEDPVEPEMFLLGIAKSVRAILEAREEGDERAMVTDILDAADEYLPEGYDQECFKTLEDMELGEEFLLLGKNKDTDEVQCFRVFLTGESDEHTVEVAILDEDDKEIVSLPRLAKGFVPVE